MSTLITDSAQVVGYTDHGGSGPALVMLHSFLMNREMFAPQVETFGESFRCVSVDLRGHGESPVAEGFDYWDVARDVTAVMDELEIQRAVLLGTSQGGFVALRVALNAPERIIALVLNGTSAEAESEATVEAYRELGRNWVALGPVDPIIDAIAAICLGDYVGADEWKARWRAVPVEIAQRNIEMLIYRDEVLSRLGEISAPALVLHGAADAAYPVERAEAIAAALPGAGEAVVIPGGAHFLSLTSAEAVNLELGRFLAANVVAAA